MTAVRLHGHLTEVLLVEVSYSSVVRYLHEGGFCLKVPGKIHPDRDELARAVFVQEMIEILNKPDDNEVWFTDECGIDGDPRTGRAWFRKGSKPKVKYDGCHLRQSVIGAVEPSSGAFEVLAVPYTDTAVFQIFIDNLAKQLRSRARRSCWFLIMHHGIKLVQSTGITLSRNIFRPIPKTSIQLREIGLN